MALTCGVTEAEVEDPENLFLSDSTAKKGQKKVKLQLGIKQSENPFLVTSCKNTSTISSCRTEDNLVYISPFSGGCEKNLADV